MRKIFRPKNWSLGTNLGFPGPGSQKALHEIFRKPHFLFILDLNNTPALVASFPCDKNLNGLSNRCGSIDNLIFLIPDYSSKKPEKQIHPDIMVSTLTEILPNSLEVKYYDVQVPLHWYCLSSGHISFRPCRFFFGKQDAHFLPLTTSTQICFGCQVVIKARPDA